MPKFDDIPGPPTVVTLQPGNEQDISLVQSFVGEVHDIYARIAGFQGKKLVEYPSVKLKIYNESTSPGTLVREQEVFDTAFGIIGLPVGTHRINLINESTKPATIHVKIYSS